MSKISSIRALQILDSRGQPTLRVFVQTQTGARGVASVPSGASTGQHEALELRDGDLADYAGRSVHRAVSHVNEQIARLLVGQSVQEQAAIDERMIQADGSADKSRLGANAILGVSMAAARAAACEQGLELFEYLAAGRQPRLPLPMLNIINGGAHAENSIDFQEFMIRPIGANSLSEALRWSVQVYAQLKKILRSKKLACGVGDEGGFAPFLDDDTQALELLVQAIEQAGYEPGRQISLALDCAASELYQQGLYQEKKRLAQGLKGACRTSKEQIQFLSELVDHYPIDSIEDGLGEEDWQGWQQLTQRLGKRCQLVGDDIFVTNPRFVQRAIREGCANAVLIKPNQIGTVSETLHTIDLAAAAGLRTIVSHRSGETEDTFIADLAVATGCGQIKTGAPCRSDRVAKYNRLLEIEAQMGERARLA